MRKERFSFDIKEMEYTEAINVFRGLGFEIFPAAAISENLGTHRYIIFDGEEIIRSHNRSDSHFTNINDLMQWLFEDENPE